MFEIESDEERRQREHNEAQKAGSQCGPVEGIFGTILVHLTGSESSIAGFENGRKNPASDDD